MILCEDEFAGVFDFYFKNDHTRIVYDNNGGMNAVRRVAVKFEVTGDKTFMEGAIMVLDMVEDIQPRSQHN